MNDIRICFFGDSFVQGVCDEKRLGFPGRLAAALPAQHSVFNQGVRRHTSGDIAARWQNEAACRLPSASLGRVVFSFGTNDCVIENGSARERTYVREKRGK